MPAHSRPKDGVASLAYVAGIHVLLASDASSKTDVDGRDKPGHDGEKSPAYSAAARFGPAWADTM
jgi:hypothetical protein